MEDAPGRLKRNEARILITYFQLREKGEERQRDREGARQMDPLTLLRLRSRPGQSQMSRFHKQPRGHARDESLGRRSSLTFSLSLSLSLSLSVSLEAPFLIRLQWRRRTGAPSLLRSLINGIFRGAEA